MAFKRFVQNICKPLVENSHKKLCAERQFELRSSQKKLYLTITFNELLFKTIYTSLYLYTHNIYALMVTLRQVNRN